MKLLITILLLTNLFSKNLSNNLKLIALSPAINEIVYALNSGDKIIANTDYCNYPKEAKNKPKVGGYFSPNLEKIVALKPDIVLMQSNTKFANRLNKLGIKTAIFKLNTINDIKNSIKLIGNILDKQSQANKIISSIDTKLNNLKNIIKNQKILIVIGHNTKLDKKVYVVGHNLYLEDIIKASGNHNAYSDTSLSQPIFNLEKIISTNADIIVLLAPYMHKKNLSKEDLLNPWAKLPINAVKHHTIYIADKEYAGIPSQRLIYFLDDFKRILENAKNKQTNSK